MLQSRDVRILLIDDEPPIREFLELGLRHEGFQIAIAEDGLTGVNLAQKFNPHIVILDIMMPGMNGFEVCKLIKKARDASIIMLTAKDEVEDKVKGLTTGADDYIVKPFSFDELVARIHVQIRNQFPQLLNAQDIGPFHIDDGRKEISYKNHPLALSSTEYELLKYMVLNHGIVLSKSKILDVVWGYDFGGQANIVEVYISALRDKLGADNRDVIRTVRGSGYRIDV